MDVAVNLLSLRLKTLKNWLLEDFKVSYHILALASTQ